MGLQNTKKNLLNATPSQIVFLLTRQAKLIVQLVKGLFQRDPERSCRLPFTGNAVFEGTSCHLAIIRTEARVTLILEGRLGFATESWCAGSNV